MYSSTRPFLLFFLPFLVQSCADTEHLLEPTGSLELLREFSVGSGAEQNVYQPAVLTPEGIIVLKYGQYPQDEAAVLYDIETGKAKKTYTTSSFTRLYDHQAVALSPDGKLMAVAAVYNGYGSAFAIWNLETGLQQSSPIEWPVQGRIVCLKFSNDGKRIAAGGTSGVVVWDLESPRRMYKLEKDYFEDVTGVEFSPSGDTLLSSPPGFWSVPEERLIEDFSEERGSFDAAVFIDGGRKVLAGGYQGISLFPTNAKEEIGRIHNYHISEEGDDKSVESTKIVSLAASHDGLLFAAGDYDGLVKVLDVKSGALVGSGKGRIGINSIGLAFSAFDSSLLISSTQYGTVYLWRVHQ